MAVELDHIFIRASAGAPEAEQLREFGLLEGSPNRHPGQGTACRRFYFRNAMIELLWVEDESEARNERSSPLKLAERSVDTTGRASPFGVCVRPANGVDDGAPFASWPYRPTYLPEPLAILVAASPIEEPLWFYLGFSFRPDQTPPDRRQPLAHSAGLNEITGVQLISPLKAQSEAMTALVKEKVLTVRSGTEHLLELTFDSGAKGRSHNFRPALPLVFYW